MKSLVAIAFLAILSSAVKEPFLIDIQQLTSTKFGEHLFNLVDLQVEQGSKLAHVVDFIQKMLDELLQSQAADDSEYAIKDSKFKETVVKLEQNVESLIQEQDLNQRLIQQLSEDISSLTQTIVSVKKQQQLLNSKEQELIDARNEEHQEYENRNNKQLSNLRVIADILKKLSNAILGTSSLIQLTKEIESIKKELGEKHPVALLVELTSTFDETTVKRVIEKLEKVRDGIQSQMEQEGQKEAINAQKFQVMIKQLKEIREKQQLTKTESLVKIRQNDLILCQKKNEELKSDLESTQELLLRTKSQSETTTSNYSARRKERGEEISVVKLALSILQDQN